MVTATWKPNQKNHILKDVQIEVVNNKANLKGIVD